MRISKQSQTKSGQIWQSNDIGSTMSTIKDWIIAPQIGCLYIIFIHFDVSSSQTNLMGASVSNCCIKFIYNCCFIWKFKLASMSWQQSELWKPSKVQSQYPLFIADRFALSLGDPGSLPPTSLGLPSGQDGHLSLELRLQEHHNSSHTDSGFYLILG